ncbi:unnamed protein product [Parascedosporium putredinis]|uniref:UBA domain-containing protein n=1 Tax=Parascedosporium putredinis TaxID=1442378 RepID=A0A9P1H3I5_9PEZI|nr:unnamed protein product [Parascedosporium putredinis]CAI7995870.1 unnamed protein product [Parascedosporium putredinis]
MGQSDLNLLLEMGFDKARAELAIKKAGALNQALEWLEANEDKSLDELLAQTESKGADDDDEEEQTNINFKNADLASYHATKSGHTDFSESTDEIAPLTDEQRAARLEELRQKLKAKRENQAVLAREEAKQNEKIRMKSTRDAQDVKDELQRKEQIKEAARKRQEKLNDIEAKRRIKAKIEADKEERKRKAEADKAAREGRAVESPLAAAPAAAPAPAARKVDHNEARLKLQTSKGPVMKTFPAETTLFEVAQTLESEQAIQVSSFSTTFPRKTFEGQIDFGKTLKEAGLVPSAVLNVK